MPLKHSEDEYGSQGSVPNSVELSGSGAGPLSVRSNPDDFGAQVGGAVEKLGQEGEQVTQHFGNMMAETAGNNAEVGFIQEAGALDAKYKQYEGNQAEAMRPQYEAELAATREKYRANLPLIAQHGYDMSSTRQMANYTSQYANYSAGQVKQGNIQSYNALTETAKNQAGNLSTVTDDAQMGALAGKTIHATNAIADTKGWAMYATGTDKDTGRLTFGDSPEAVGAKAQYGAELDSKLAGIYMTAGKTVTDNQGATAGADWFQKHWDMMPDAAKVQANAYLAPKIRNEKIAGIVDNTIASGQQDYTQKIMTGQNLKSPLDVIRQNEGQGYFKDNKGEVVNGINSLAFPKEFAEAKNILDTQGQAAATKYSDNFYQKNIIDKNGIDSLPVGTQAIVADGIVNHGGGAFGQSLVQAAKNGESPQQLIDMRRAEYQRLAKADPDTYGSQLDGWNARLDRLQQNIPNPAAPPQPLQKSKGDYWKENEEDFVQKAVNDHLAQFPGDEYGALSTGNRARTQINHIISMENKKLSDDTDIVKKSIDGGFTNGRKPTNLQEVALFSPDARDALDHLEQSKPSVVDGMLRHLAANAKEEGKKGYGDGFLSTMNRIASDDPTDSIKDSTGLAEMYGNRQDLYVNGYTQAGKLLRQAQTPEGKSTLASQAQFLNDLRSKMVAGETDTDGKTAFNKALPSFFTQYNNLSKDGKEGSLLKMDDKNPFLQGLKIPTSSEMTSKKIESTSKWLTSTSDWGDMFGGRESPASVFTPAEKVMSDFHDGKISVAQKEQQLRNLGVGPSQQVPRPE